MKRALSLFMVVALLLAFIIIPINADEAASIDLEKAISIAKDKLGLDTEGYELSSNYMEGYYNGRKVWELYWYKSNGNGDGFNTVIDAETGEILNYNHWTNNQNTSKLPKYSREEAVNAAKAFLDKVCPEKLQESEYLDNPSENMYIIYNGYYYINFIRKYNNIEVEGDSLSVSLDKNTLQVTSFNMNWTKSDLPDLEKVIDLDAAKKIFADKLGLELSYQLIYPSDNSLPQKAMLVYTLKNGYTPIDAITGELLYSNYYYPYYMNYGAGSYVEDSIRAEVKAKMTLSEQIMVDDASKYISKEEAVDAAKEYLPELENYTLTYASLSPEYNSDKANWYFNWSFYDDETKDFGRISASVDALTKEIKYFYKESKGIYATTDEKPTYTEEQAKDIAAAFLEKIQPDKYKVTEQRVYENPNPYINPNPVISYNFSFERKENDIFCPFNSLNVSVSAYTGEVMNYTYNWLDVEIPTIENIIDLDKAYTAMYSKSNLKLKYIKLYDYSKGYDYNEIKLAYMLDNFYGIIDAETGKVLNYDGSPYTETQNITEFTDISGNKAEEDIKLLVDVGLIQITEPEFRPDDKILQKDFVKLLMRTFEPYYYYYSSKYIDAEDSEDDYYYRLALQRKILSEAEKNPDAYITKQEASKMFIRALNYGYFAEKSWMFKLSFDDANKVNSKYKGYVLLAKEFGIFNLESNMFNAEQLLTKGDTATAIVNFLKVDLTTEE